MHGLVALFLEVIRPAIIFLVLRLVAPHVLVVASTSETPVWMVLTLIAIIYTF